MLFDFIVQSFFSSIFFLGISGVGILILKFFKIKEINNFLRLSLGFFLSLSLYTAFSVLALFEFPNKILTLIVFTVFYFLFSFLIFIKVLLDKNEVKKQSIYCFLKKYWSVFTTLLLSLFIFFQGIYKTSLLDEWLHRPIVKFFVDNGIFPLKNPFNPEEIFIYSYHYGTQIVASAIKLIFPLSVSESLDVVKSSFFIASFLLFFGIINHWSKNKKYSLLGAIVILFCGGSFFLFDNFSTSHLALWGTSEGRPFNFPLAYMLFGITWVNLPISIAFTFFLQELFLKKKNYFNSSLLLLPFLLLGFFLISELFGILMIILIGFLIFFNLIKNDNPQKNILIGLFFIFILSVGIFLTGGVITDVLKDGENLKKVASVRSFDKWGYPDESIIVNPLKHPIWYLKDFLLEILIFLIIIFGIIKRKITFGKNPLFFLSLPIAFFVPFIFSTSMGDLNLYKLTAYGILVLHLLIFYFFSFFERKTLFYFILIMFILGSLPMMLFNLNLKFGKSAMTESFRCAQNNLCYDKDIKIIFENFEKNNPGLKKIIASVTDSPYVIDSSNSFVVNNLRLLSDKENLQKNYIQYVFYTPDLEKIINKNELEMLRNFKEIEERGKYKILKVY